MYGDIISLESQKCGGIAPMTGVLERKVIGSLGKTGRADGEEV